MTPDTPNTDKHAQQTRPNIYRPQSYPTSRHSFLPRISSFSNRPLSSPLQPLTYSPTMTLHSSSLVKMAPALQDRLWGSIIFFATDIISSKIQGISLLSQLQRLRSTETLTNTSNFVGRLTVTLAHGKRQTVRACCHSLTRTVVWPWHSLSTFGVPQFAP